jgi:hypothetical protein
MRVLNFLLFQIAWFACVVGAARDMPWLGVAVTMAILYWHFHKTGLTKPECMLMVAAFVIGACFDQLMLSMHLVEYQQHGWSVSLVPVWILALWLAFATTLNVSLAWMQRRYFVSLLFGAIGGPLAYLGAERIGAVFLRDYPSYIALSLGWAVITPTLLYIANQLNGSKTEPST